MTTLSLDLSSKTGWALFNDGKYIESGVLDKVAILDFDMKNEPNKSIHYPLNIITAAEEVGTKVKTLIESKKPDFIVLENSTKGRNRHSQRFIEFMHFCVLKQIIQLQIKFSYLDPSQWRSALDIRLSNEDKKNNRLVTQGKKRGKVNRKHLALRYVEDTFGLKLKVYQNDIADAICLNKAWWIKNP